MKIDKIFIICCKADFYLTKPCIASIRYWNTTTPVYLVKDYSQGNFDTTELEKAFNVSVFHTALKQMGPYVKLVPFIEENGSRILVHDSDIVWIKDIITELEAFGEDLILHGYSPIDPTKEMTLWYFNMPNLQKHYNNYRYPGFLFNGGQFVCNTSKFSINDFSNTIVWKENVAPVFEDTFLCEDQGVLNYVIAKKIETGTITYRQHTFYTWGYDTLVNKINLNDPNSTKHLPALIHWLGRKTGLLSGINGNHLLNFYEKNYYAKLKNGFAKRYMARLLRTLKHPVAYSKVILKKIIAR